MNKFEKVSYNQYCDLENVWSRKDEWENIRLPVRSTAGSAGYDFFAPFSFVLNVGDTIRIKTGIRVQLDEDKFLMICPRSGLGFKYRIQLDNTIGVIDSDYFFSDNEGQISVKLTNDGRGGESVSIKKGEAFVQGIIVQYFKTCDDISSKVRNGGFGSTDNKI